MWRVIKFQARLNYIYIYMIDNLPSYGIGKNNQVWRSYPPIFGHLMHQDTYIYQLLTESLHKVSWILISSQGENKFMNKLEGQVMAKLEEQSLQNNYFIFHFYLLYI